MNARSVASLSILVPTFKRPEALDRNLASIGRSGLMPHEVLVGDDGGDGPTGTVVEKYSGVLPLVILPPNGQGSLSSNLNRLIDKATGDWILIVHDDDFLVGSDAVQLKDIDPHYDLFFTDHYLADEQGQLLYDKSEENSKTYKRSLLAEGLQRDHLQLGIDQTICLDGFYLKRSFLGTLRLDKKYGSVSDYFWLLGILGKNPLVGYTPKRTFAYTVSSVGLTAGGLNINLVTGFRDLLSSHAYAPFHGLIKKKISVHTWHAVNKLIKKGQGARALGLLKDIRFTYIHSTKARMLLPIQIIVSLLRYGRLKEF